MKNRIKRVPYLGSFLVWLNYQKNSRKHHLDSVHLLESHKDVLDKIGRDISELRDDMRESNNSHSEQLGIIKNRLVAREHETTVSRLKNAEKKSSLFADNHELDAFYLAFENKFRGAEEEISSRLSDYIQTFMDLDESLKKKPVLDIGCGRGEFLSFVKNLGLNPVGVDLNASMVEEARTRGFDAIQEDAVSYLARQKDNSLSAITGFHLVEHIPFENILTLFSECYRALAPGGFILFETPNPENVIIGSCNFYTDPSHLHPIPPHLLQFTAEYQGFDPVKIMRLRAIEIETDESLPKGLAGIVERFSNSPDYSIIGYKPALKKSKQ